MLSSCVCCLVCIFFLKQKTAYEMRISDWSSDVCSSDLWKPSHCMSLLMASMYSWSSLAGLVSSKRRLHSPPNSLARPKFRQIDLARSEERRVGKECDRT